MPSETYLDNFLRAYLACALWSSIQCDESGDNCSPLDDTHDPDDIAPEALAQAREECADFIESTGIESDEWWDAEQAGHDFWLTRVGHGAGFWDRHSVGTELHARGERYTAASKAAGSRDAYVGDDGRVYFS